MNWDSFKWRNHQPDIGRFFNIDPLAEKYYYNSPYAFSENKVVAHVELEGLEAVEAAMLAAKYSALLASMKSGSTQGAVNRLMTNSSSLTPSNIPGGNNNLPAGNKALGTLKDAKTVTDATAKNTKILTNEVSKDALAATKAVGTGLEVAGMGTPVSGVGAAINAAAGVLDEARQVTLEGKPVEEAGTDVVVNGAINATFSGLGGAAKSTVSGEGKQAVDAAIDAHSFSFSNLFQWVSDQIRGTDEKTKQ